MVSDMNTDITGTPHTGRIYSGSPLDTEIDYETNLKIRKIQRLRTGQQIIL